ncbi:hypothetical protein [Flavobacterium sp. WC2430]|uniref:hypothetical protein n=1 Tax=Flavobacterium sp. WC2430 TaxID=3234137 RepID=UPI0034670DD0
MKLKIITIFILIFAFTNAYAQSNPTFEQTVDYIIKNTKGRVMYPGALDAYSRVKGYYLKDVKIEKNGRIEFTTDQKFDDNKFNIIFNIFDLVQKVDYPDGIRAYKFLVHFNGLNVSAGYGITYATDADAQKVARALRYLKTVCIKENDLFSKPVATESKVQLTREETIDYINKMVTYDGKTVAVICDFSKTGKNEYYGYNWSEYGNNGLKYNSYDKNYSFKTFYQKYSWNNQGSGENKLYSSDSEISEKIYFKYFDYIGIGAYTGANNMVLNYLEVNFKHSENNVRTTFRIYLPWSKYCSGASFGNELPFKEQYTKEIARLTKAFERLKELDSEDKDPFGE